MEQQKDTHYMTREFLESKLVENTNRIKQLEEHIQRVTQRDYATAAKLQTMRDGMHDWTVSELENGDLTTEQAQVIADWCEFGLTKEVEVTVNVEYYVTVNVPAGEEVEDIINEIDFDAISYDTDKIGYVASSVNGIDF